MRHFLFLLAQRRLFVPIVGLFIACDGDQKITVYTQPPTVTIQSPINGSDVDQGVPILMRGLVTDEKFDTDLATLSAQWTANGVPICLDSVVDELGFMVCTHVFDDAGGVSLLLLATNPDGETAQAESIVMVNENAAPTAEIISPEAGEFGYSDVLTRLSAQVYDEEDDSELLTIAWTSSLDGELTLVDEEPDSNGLSTSFTMLTTGQHVLSLRVTDTTGRFSESSIVYDVGGENTVPECQIVSPLEGDSILNNTQESLVGSAYDPDVALDVLTVEWSSTIDGLLGSQNPDPTGQFSLPVSNLTSGAHTITLKVADETGATCTQSVDVVVGNPPQVQITFPSNGFTFNEDEMLTFEAVVSDVEDSSTDISLQWSSDIDGLFCGNCNADSNGTSTALAFSWLYGIHTVTVQATDSDGFSSQDSIIIYVNDLPSVPQIAIAPSAPTSSDDLTVNILTPSNDLEADPITYAYNWVKAGVSSSVIDPTLPYAETTRGDEWELRVTPNDGFGDGDVGVTSVVIGNSPPVALSITLTPSIPVEGDVLDCLVSSSHDEDGDPISYAYDWLVNGSAIGFPGSALNSAYFENGDMVQCVVTPNDGFEDGPAFVSSTVTVQNTAPSISGADLQPLPAYEASVLTCTPLNPIDVDGDLVSFIYNWLVNTQSINIATATLDGSYFNKGDVVECMVTPTDGAASGSAVASNSVTISNTAPELAEGYLSPDPAYEDTVLNCAPGMTSDDDGDTVSVGFDWRRNGSVLGIPNSTLSGTQFSKGDEVVCILTPNDGFTNGLVVETSSVVISNTPPALSSLTLSPSSPSEVDDLNCLPGNATDIDGDSITFLYSWTVDGQVLNVNSATLTGASFNRGQQVSCTATPTDGSDNGVALTSSSVTVLNSPPEIGSVSLSPNNATEASVLTCTPSNVIDADGDAISVDYNWSVNGQLININSSTIHGAVFNRDDFVICYATPTDGYDAGAQVASNPVSIQNSAPTLDETFLSPTTVYESTVVYCVAGNATDIDGDSVIYQYNWYLDGVMLGTSLNAISGQFFNKGHSIQCGITPTDGIDSGVQVMSAAVVVNNTPPTIASVAISPSSATVNDVLTCNLYGVNDDDADTVTATYQWIVDGTGTGHSGSTLSGSLLVSGQSVQCRATPNDGEASGASVDSQAVSIGNTPPVLSSVSLSPSTAFETTTLQCTPGAASDADGSPVTFGYQWNIDGVMNNIDQDTLTGAYFNKGDQVFCQVTPNDGTGDGLPVSSNTITIQNTPPSLTSASISPSPAFESSILSCGAGSASDVDGDAVGFDYSWKKNGSSLGHSGQQINGLQFNKGDTMICVVTPNDGQDSGAPVESNGLVISNTAPSISSVSIDPAQVFSDTTMVADIQGWSDIDGDSPSYLYEWVVNGSPVSSSSTLAPGSFIKSDQISVSVIPTDGTNNGSGITSATIVVENTAPSAPVVEVQPTDAEPGDDLNCVIAQGSVDIDGDSISYQYSWSNNGVLQSSLNNINPISGSLTSQNDIWSCTVTPNDGETDGATAFDSQVVLDVTPPSTPVLDALDPYRNETTIVITGVSESDAQIDLDIDCDSGSNIVTTIANSNGFFSITVSIQQGDACDFSAVAIDANGNLSATSNVVTTEACAIPDEYEDNTGYGDTCGASINEWGALSDTVLNTVYVTGNILTPGDSDWYSFDATQSVTTTGINTYNAGISLVSGSSDYQIVIYRGSCATAESCSSDVTEYNFFAEDLNEGANHVLPSDLRYCQDGSLYNECQDFTTTYYVEVNRLTSGDCTGYELEFSNGY